MFKGLPKIIAIVAGVAVLIWGGNLLYRQFFSGEANKVLNELKSLASKDSLNLDRGRVLGASLDYEVYTTVLTSDGSYSLLQLIDGKISDDSFDGNITAKMPDGELVAGKYTILIPEFTLADGKKSPASIIERAMTVLKLKSGEYLALKITKGELKSGRLTGTTEARTLDSGNLLYLAVTGHEITEGYISPISAYISPVVRLCAFIVLKETELRHPSLVVGEGSKKVLAVETGLPAVGIYNIENNLLLADPGVGVYRILGGVNSSGVPANLTVINQINQAIAQNQYVSTQNLVSPSLAYLFLGPGSITTAMLQNGAVTADKIAAGVIPTVTGVSDGSINEADLVSSNDPSSGQCLTYNSGTGGFTWGTCGTSGGSGTITGVTAGVGLTGGGTSGTISLAISAQTGGGLTATASGLSLLRTCGDGEILQWTASTSTWDCAVVSGGPGGGIGTLQVDDTTVVSSAVTIDFLGSDFDLTNSPTGEGNLSIDYTNSKIVRSDQTQSITGAWDFSTLSIGDTNIPLTGASLALDFNNVSDRTLTITNSSTGLANLSVEGTISASNFSGSSSGNNTGDQTITLQSDVTGTGTGTFNTTIAAGAVTLGKMANLAANSIIGNNTGISATPLALTASQVKSLLAIATGDVSGLGTIATQNSNSVTITGGSINGTTVGASTTGTGAFTTLSASGQITSTVTTGTAPFVVSSTTNVANLNASSLGGATFSAPGAIGGGTPGSGAFTTLSASSTLSANGGLTIAANQGLTFTSGTGTFTQNYSNTTGTSATINHTNSASSGTNTSTGLSVAITGTNNAAGSNTITGINFPNVTAKTNNTYNALTFGTGFNNFITSGTFNLSAAGALSGITTLGLSGQLTSTASTGTAPFVVASTTNVANLNASSLGGATFASPGSIGSGTPGTGAFTTISASSTITGTTLNGTTGINTGASAGTQRIDSTGNLVSIGNITGIGAVALNTTGNTNGLTLNTATGASGNSGAITIKSGGTTTSGTSGNISIDVGTGASANGTISIGGTNSGTITLGRSTQGITLPGFAGNNAVLYGTTATGVLGSATTSTSGLCLVSGAATGYTPTWTTCPGGGGGSWSSLTSPTAGLSLNMSSAGTAYYTTLTWDQLTGANNLFTLQDATGNTGTGYVLTTQNVGTSTAKPFRIVAQGNTILDTTATGGLTLTSRAASTWGTTTGNLTFQVAGTGTSANVQIGAGGGGSATPDFLVVDQATGALPAGTNGAIALDSTGKFNIYEGAWKVLCNKTDLGCGTGSGAALSGLTQATTGNTINNGDNAQVWNWSLTTAGKTAFSFSENVASNATGNPYILGISTLSTSTANPLIITAQGTANGVKVDTSGLLSAIGTGGIRATELAAGTYANALTLSSATNSITVGTLTATGGTINNTAIGGSTTAAGAFTTVGASGQITSTVTTGTAPFVVASTTNVANLNASSLSGATFASPGSIGSTSAGSGAFTTLSASSTLSANGGLTIAANQGLTFTSGTGTATQNYSNTTGTANTLNVTNSGSSGTNTVIGKTIAITGTINGTGSNTTTGINFANVAAATNNTYNGITFGTGLNNYLTSGTVNLTAAGALSGLTTLGLSGQLTSTVTTGTAPFVVSSTTNIPNLNASSLSGATFAAPGSIGSTTAGSGAFTTLSASSTLSANGGLTIAANQGLTFTSGTGTFTQNYSNTTGTSATINHTNSASSGANTSTGLSIAITGTNTAGSNTITGVNFPNVTAKTNNTYNALTFGTGFNNFITSGTFNLTAAGALSGITTLGLSGQLTSTVTTGTAPFVVSSTTNVANLNASSLGGATFASPGSIGSGTPGSGAFTTLSASSTLSANGGLTLAANQNLTFTSGTGTATQNYSNTTGTANTLNVTNSGSSGTNTVIGKTIAITGTINGTGTNTTTGINFSNVAAATNNTYYGLAFGTGLTDIIRYNSAQLISGTGILQSAGLSGTYSNNLTLSGSANSISASTFTATGGTINSTSVGATTPSTGAFTTLSATGAITGATATNTINGIIINSGAVSGVSTLGLSGAITGATVTNTINGLIINSGAITGATGLTFASGNFDQSASAGTFSTGTGAVSLNGLTTLAAGKALIITGGAGSPTATTGTVWYDTTANKFKIVENGVVKILCNTTDLGCGTGGGGGIATVKEGGTSIVTSATSANFAAADFIIIDETGGQAGIAIDYPNSKIIRSSDSAITFAAGVTFNTTGNTNGVTINTATGASGNSGAITIQTGGTSVSGTSGNILIDVGAGAAANGTITIGGTNASALALGRSAATFALISSGGLNVTTGGALSGISTIGLSGAISGATATNTINGMVINSGAVSNVSTLGLSGAITGATATNTINGIVINSGAVSSISTLALFGAITGATATNTINGIIINSGAVSGVSTLGLSGAITGATATNTINGLIINSGALSGIMTINASGQITSTVTTGTAPFVVSSTTNVANLNASSLGGATFTAPGAIGGTTPGSGAFTTLSASSTLSANGGLTIAANQNLTFTSGTGTTTQNYSNTTGTAHVINFTNSGSSGVNTSTAMSVAMTGTANAGGSNTLTGLNFPNVAAATNNTYNGITFGTGFNNYLTSGTVNLTAAGALSGITTLGLSGAITGATATNTINGIIINSGAVSSISTLGLSGAIAGATATNTINGLIINSGALSNATTLGLSGAIAGATATNTINGIIINSSAISNVTTLALSGAITGATATNTINGIIINSGAVSNVTTLGASSTVTIGSGGNAFTFNPGSGPVYTGTAMPTKRITLTPEYAGASLTGTGIGTMTSDNDTTVASYRNYYNWTSSQGTSQTYSVWIKVPLPADFDSWTSVSALTIEAWSDTLANTAIAITTYDTGNTAACSAVNIEPGTASTWTDATPTNCTNTGTWAANGIMTIKLDLSSLSNANARVGRLYLQYKAKF